MHNLKDETGKRYGWLTVLERAKSVKDDGFAYWTCKCSCGETKEVRSNDLRNGRTTSCGCKRRMRWFNRSQINKTQRDEMESFDEL